MNIITVTADKQKQQKEYTIKNNENPIAVSWSAETTKRLGRIH